MGNPQGSGDMINNYQNSQPYAYILGVYLGDGWVGNSYGDSRVGLKCIDIDFIFATYIAFEDLQTKNKPCLYSNVSKNSKGHIGKKPMYQVSVADKELNLKLKTDTNFKQIIPEYVFQWDRKNKIAFIQGLMDSEGSVSERKTPYKGRAKLSIGQMYLMSFCSTSPWIDDFINLCRSIGLVIGKKGQKIEKSGKVCRYFYIKIKSWSDSGLHFNIKRKQDRVERYMSHITTPQRLHVSAAETV